MRIALIQINPKIGDFENNRQQILELSRKAAEEGADLALFPELSLCGYPPMDLLNFPEFTKKNQQALDWLAEQLPPGIAVAVGCVYKAMDQGEKHLQNGVVVLESGREVFRQAKTLLPTYDVFDERRYFTPASTRQVWNFRGTKIGFAICEDLWWEETSATGNPYGVDPVEELAAAGAQVILSPSASPWFPGKKSIRYSIMEKIGRKYSIPVVYVNQIGGNDSLIFDGSSLATDSKGSLVLQLPGFEPASAILDIGSGQKSLNLLEDRMADLQEALVLGLRDYVKKCGFSSVHLGLSGGIDSALVAALAVMALGPEKVRGYAMPSRYSSQHSLKDAQDLAENLGIHLETIPIEGPFGEFLQVLEPQFRGRPMDLTEENIQARIRGVYMMAISNKTGSMVLTTGNKSELATGYCTLYGDMAGGLGVIGDLFKTEVYELCRHINRNGEVIPENTLTKAPSAELRPDQKDEDSLPPYPELDGILKHYLMDHKTEQEIISKGFTPQTVRFVLNLVAKAEYKRWQAPPVLKVSPLAFGTGRRHPLARSYFEIH